MNGLSHLVKVAPFGATLSATFQSQLMFCNRTFQLLLNERLFGFRLCHFPREVFPQRPCPRVGSRDRSHRISCILNKTSCSFDCFGCGSIGLNLGSRRSNPSARVYVLRGLLFQRVISLLASRFCGDSAIFGRLW